MAIVPTMRLITITRLMMNRHRVVDVLHCA
jgi:hypothetical protein